MDTMHSLMKIVRDETLTHLMKRQALLELYNDSVLYEDIETLGYVLDSIRELNVLIDTME